MFRIFLINIVLIFSLTACQITPPKSVSKEIKWEADETVVADAKGSNSEENSVDSENTKQEESTDKSIKETPTPTASSQKPPSKTPTPKVEKPSIRYVGMTVYVTKSGKKFHREDCSSLSKSKIPMLFEEASAKKYTPCGICKP